MTPKSSESGREPGAAKMASDRQTAEHVILVAVALDTMLVPLNSTMIAVALPDLLGDFGRSLAWGSWIVASYLVAMSAVQPLGGSLGDRHGRRRLFGLRGDYYSLAPTGVDQESRRSRSGTFESSEGQISAFRIVIVVFSESLT